MKRTEKIQMAVLASVGILILLSIGFICYGTIPPRIKTTSEQVKITGMYGIKINVGDIEKVILSDEIPKILARTNGLGMEPIRKGCFTLEEFGRTKLFLQSYEPPYIIIESKEDDVIIINYKDPELTKSYYMEIFRAVNDY